MGRCSSPELELSSHWHIRWTCPLFSHLPPFLVIVIGTSCFAGKRRYNIKLWKTFTDCFNCLPVAAIVDEKIFCMHGGLSPELNDMDQIKRVLRPTDVPDTGVCFM